MTKRKRKILIAVLALFFAVAAPLTIFYSLGWRFDWSKKEITRPGIFFFKVKPNSAKVLINGESEDKTDFFFGSVVIDNLLPKKYQVLIKKENYHNWGKNLEIKRGEVTEAKNIILIPQNPDFEKISQNTESFYFKNGEIILKEEEESWALKSYDLKNNVKSLLTEDFSKKESDLIDILFFEESSDLLAKLFEGESFSYYIIKRNPLEIIPLDFLPSPEKVYLEKNSLFVLKQGKLRKADLPEKELSEPLVEDIVSLETEKAEVFYLDSEGLLFQSDLSFQEKTKLNRKAFPIKKETEYSLKVSPPHFFLKEKNSLYYLKDQVFKKIADNIKDFKFSPDRKKIAYSNNGELWLYILEDTNEYPKRKAGEKVFITRLSEEIKDVFWYTNHYLVFSTAKDIKIAETDDRDKINMVSLAQFKNPEIFWESPELYFLSENNFYISETLIP